jgi:hypothetical protein
MTLAKALADIETLSRARLTKPPAGEQEIPCHDTRRAVQLLAEAYEHLRRRDPLYADRRRSASLAPPPASVPPD